jgi:hypothetical protein
MATVTQGYTWTSGETVTPTKLNSAAAPTVVVADNEITTSKILDANVTNAKLATGIDASKLTTGTLPIARIADGAVSAAKLGANEQKQLAKAWVHFDGSGTFDPNPSTSKIKDSFNVQSVNKLSSGEYAINFANNLSNANYAVFITSSNASSGGLLACETGSRGVGTFGIVTFALNGTPTDSSEISVVVF